MNRARWILADDDVVILENWSQAQSGRRADRARIVLLTAEGRKAKEISRALRVTLATVYKWRKRFLSHGIVGLVDSARPGQPRRLTKAQRDEIVRLTSEELPPSGRRWTIRGLASTLHVTQHQVRKVWEDHDLRPHARGAGLWRHAALRERELHLFGLLIYPRYSALAVGIGAPSTRTQRSFRPRNDEAWSPLRALFRTVSNTSHASASAVDGLAELAAFVARIDDLAGRGAVYLTFSCHAPVLDPLARPWLGARTSWSISAEQTVAHWVDLVEAWLRELSATPGEYTHVGSLAEAVCKYLEHGRGAFSWVRASTPIIADAEAPRSAPDEPALRRAREHDVC